MKEEETQERMALLDMEKALQDDENGDHCKQLDQSLNDYGQQLKRRLDQGLPPDEYAATERLFQAVDAARRTVNTVWKGMHPNT